MQVHRCVAYCGGLKTRQTDVEGFGLHICKLCLDDTVRMRAKEFVAPRRAMVAMTCSSAVGRPTADSKIRLQIKQAGVVVVYLACFMLLQEMIRLRQRPSGM